MTTDEKVSIQDQLSAELKDAMKKGDKARRDVIRQVLTEVRTVSSQAGVGEVTDEVYRVVIAAYIKKMSKARDEYREMGERGAEMADKLDFEIEYLSRWLPSKLGEEETLRLVRQTIEDLNVAGNPKAVGKVVGALMKPATTSTAPWSTVSRVRSWGPTEPARRLPADAGHPVAGAFRRRRLVVRAQVGRLPLRRARRALGPADVEPAGSRPRRPFP